MAVTWLGSACTGKIVGDNLDPMALAILSNDRFSGVNVTVRRLSLQVDVTSTVPSSTTQFVQALTYRGSSGVTIGDCVTTAPKCSFDTQQSSSPLVRLYYPATGDGINDSVLAGTPDGSMVWRQWGSKLRTGAEQQLVDDKNQLPTLIKNHTFLLRPGQCLGVRADSVEVGNNNPGFGWVINVVWQEEPVATHTISGNVTLSGSGVVGAKVIVLVADDAALTNATLWGTYTTTGGGAWISSAIPDGKYAYAYAQHDAGGGTYYSATGAPYIT